MFARAPPFDSPADVARDDSRLKAAMELHLKRVWRTLLQLGVEASAVDDAAQNVFLVAARKMPEITPGRELPYLMGIALKVASDARNAQARRHRREVSLDALVVSPTDERLTPDRALERQRARAQLDAMLASMPEDMREAFVLFELEEMSAPEVATALEIPLGTVASRVRRAREHIRQSIEAQRGVR